MIELLLLLGFGSLGYAIYFVWKAVDQMHDDLATLNVSSAKHYADLIATIDGLKKTLDRICSDHLHSQVDFRQAVQDVCAQMLGSVQQASLGAFQTVSAEDLRVENKKRRPNG